MAEMIDEKTKRELKKILSKLTSPVSLLLFTREQECPMCKEQQRILETIASVSKKVTLRIFDFIKEKNDVQKYRITKVPATAVIARKDYGLRFYGISAGYEFSSLVETILLAASGKPGFNPEFTEMVNKMDTLVHLEIMTTLT